MSLQNKSTNLVCLFHTHNNAQAAMSDLGQAGIAPSSITLIGGPDTSADAFVNSQLAFLGMPNGDYDHLKDGIRNGGCVVVVTAETGKSDIVQNIFARHSAKKIDEARSTGAAAYAGAVLPVATAPMVADIVQDEAAMPGVAKELNVGTRAVDREEFRIFRRVIELPVDGSIDRLQEHVTIMRRPVDHDVTNGDLAFSNHVIELTETAEEAVILKNARVVEEVLVSKQATERVQIIHDTVRRTEVEMEQIPATATFNSKGRANQSI